MRICPVNIRTHMCVHITTSICHMNIHVYTCVCKCYNVDIAKNDESTYYLVILSSLLRSVAECGSVLHCLRCLAACSLHCNSMQSIAVCCSVLQCVAVCCSVLQCAAVCCGVLQCVAVCCGALRCVAVYCGVLRCVAVCCSVLRCAAVCCGVLRIFQPVAAQSVYKLFCTHTSHRHDTPHAQCVAVGCTGFQCVAVSCSVLQCVAECCSACLYINHTHTTPLMCNLCCSVLQCVAVCCSVLQCMPIHILHPHDSPHVLCVLCDGVVRCGA